MADRGTSNSNSRGSAEDRRRRREWLVNNFRANTNILEIFVNEEYSRRHEWSLGTPAPADLIYGINHVTYVVVPACRCYRCGCILTVRDVTVDRRKPGCKGGTYRRDNIRPACLPCNSSTGAVLASKKVKKKSC